MLVRLQFNFSVSIIDSVPMALIFYYSKQSLVLSNVYIIIEEHRYLT